VVVRDATAEDTEHIVDFNHRLAAESERKILDREILARGVRRGFDHPELCRYFIAEVDGEPAGMTMLTYELTDWKDGVIWWLQSVFVRPRFRKSGVFRAIYAHIRALAQASPDARALALYVKRYNQRAVEVYKAVGMSDGDYDVMECDI
jgi:GNAT superfamily N-acetyltransferase